MWGIFFSLVKSIDGFIHQGPHHLTPISPIAEHIRQPIKMVRKLKYHESKLLRKHDFVNYKQDNDHRDHDVVRRYMIQKPEDYHKYNKICGVCRALLLMVICG